MAIDLSKMKGKGPLLSKTGKAYDPLSESGKELQSGFDAVKTIQSFGKPATQPASTIAKPPVNPAVSSVRPAIAVAPPKAAPSPVAPPAPYGGVPDASDPAMVGGRAMLDARMPAPTPTVPPPAPTTAPDVADTRAAQLKALQDSYLGTFSPSSDESAVSGQLGDVATQTAQQTAAARQAYSQRVGAINEQATLQPFLTGRQTMASNELANQLAALQSSSEAQTLPLSTRLAQLQADRLGKQTRAEKELGFATPSVPIQVSAGASLYDPTTGKSTFTAPGAVRSENQPATVQEFEYARSQGYTGSFTDYQNEDANRKRVAAGGSQDLNRMLTPAELQLYGAPAGTTFADVMGQVPEKNLSGEAAKVYSIATTIKPEIEQVKALLQRAGRLRISQILSGLDPAASRLIDQIADKVGRLRSGGAINRDEADRFKNQILRAGDILTGDTTSAIAALDALALEADTVAAGIHKNQPTTAGGDTGSAFDW